MRIPFLTAAALLVLALTLSARFDPRLPCLFATASLTWWAHPEPLSSMRPEPGPHALRYHFTPERAAALRLAVMSHFQLLDGDRVLAAATASNWKHLVTVEVP